MSKLYTHEQLCNTEIKSYIIIKLNHTIKLNATFFRIFIQKKKNNHKEKTRTQNRKSIPQNPPYFFFPFMCEFWCVKISWLCSNSATDVR